MKLIVNFLTMVSMLSATTLTPIDSPNKNFKIMKVSEMEGVYVVDMHQKFVNTGTDSIEFKVNKQTVDLPSNWGFSFCIEKDCYPSTVLEKIAKVAPGDTVDVSIDYVPATDNDNKYILGNAIGRFTYTNLSNPSEVYVRNYGFRLSEDNGNSAIIKLSTDDVDADLSTFSTIKLELQNLTNKDRKVSFQRYVYENSNLETKLTIGNGLLLSSSDTEDINLKAEETKLINIIGVASTGFQNNAVEFRVVDENNETQSVVYNFLDKEGTSIENYSINSRAIASASVLSIGGIHSVSLPCNGATNITLISASGRVISEIFNGNYKVENYIKFSSTSYSSGIYILKIVQNGIVQTIPLSIR